MTPINAKLINITSPEIKNTHSKTLSSSKLSMFIRELIVRKPVISIATAANPQSMNAISNIIVIIIFTQTSLVAFLSHKILLSTQSYS